MAADGTRCGSRWKLEADHVEPAAVGGPPTVDNLRLRCRAHNLRHAECFFGTEQMAAYRSGGDERRAVERRTAPVLRDDASMAALNTS